MTNFKRIRSLNDDMLKYAVGACMYCPANKVGYAEKLVNGQFNTPCIILDLEDSILPHQLADAEQVLEDSLKTLCHSHIATDGGYPLIFIRVRDPEHLNHVYTRYVEYIEVVSGFVLPKFDTTNAVNYLRIMQKINFGSHKLHYMPIIESEVYVLGDCRKELSLIHTMMDNMMQPLHILIGGNDMCKPLRVCRNKTQSIYDILLVRGAISRTLREFSGSYTVSGAIWEYFTGNDWEAGLRKELELDLLNGMIGKACVHPKQVDVVLESLKVSEEDYSDAKDIHSANIGSSGVFGGVDSGRMNEVTTNTTWASKVLLLADIYGIQEK